MYYSIYKSSQESASSLWVMTVNTFSPQNTVLQDIILFRKNAWGEKGERIKEENGREKMGGYRKR